MRELVIGVVIGLLVILLLSHCAAHSHLLQ